MRISGGYSPGIADGPADTVEVMKDLSLHIMAIVENSVTAGATEVRIEIRESDFSGLLSVSVIDNGRGMDPDTARKAVNAFHGAERGKKCGMGIALLEQAAAQTGGKLSIDSEIGRGTTVTAVFDTRHPDMKPLGDMAEALAAVMVGNPQIRYVVEQRRNSLLAFRFDSTGRNGRRDKNHQHRKLEPVKRRNARCGGTKV